MVQRLHEHRHADERQEERDHPQALRHDGSGVCA
jgi:hypothetical protein